MLVAPNIICSTLGIKDHRVVSTSLTDKHLWIELATKKGRKLPCSICGRRSRPKDTLTQRRWHHVSLWGIPVVLCYCPRRVICPDCGVRVERIPWSMGKKPISFPLITLLAFWSRQLPWDQVAKLFDVSWNTVRSAVDAAVAYGRAREDYQGVRFIGIDEISRKDECHR